MPKVSRMWAGGPGHIFDPVTASPFTKMVGKRQNHFRRMQPADSVQHTYITKGPKCQGQSVSLLQFAERRRAGCTLAP